MVSYFKLKLLRYKSKKNLNTKNRGLYNAITCYINNSDLSLYDKEEVLQEILDIILQAQFHNRNINLFIGDDYEKFCDQVIEEYLTNRSKSLKVISLLERNIILGLIISGVLVITNKIGEDILGINLNQVIFILLMVVVIIPIYKKGRQGTSSYDLFHKVFLMNSSLYRRNVKIPIIFISLLVIAPFIVEKLFFIDTYRIFLLGDIIPYILLGIGALVTIEFLKLYYKRII